MGCSDLYIQMWVTNGISHLLVSTSCREHGKGTDERYFSTGGKSCRDARHICLCDTAVQMSFRKCFFEDSGFGSACKVSIQNDQIVMLFSKVYQCVSVTLSCCDLLYF